MQPETYPMPSNPACRLDVGLCANPHATVATTTQRITAPAQTVQPHALTSGLGFIVVAAFVTLACVIVGTWWYSPTNGAHSVR